MVEGEFYVLYYVGRFLVSGGWLSLAMPNMHTRMFGLSLVKHVHGVGSYAHLSSQYETIMSHSLLFRALIRV
jgi:hypothetical protein